MAPKPREALADALRGAALLGVLAVNAMGYGVAPWGPLLGVWQPAGAWLTDTANALALWLTATLLQGKAYPLLAFLFGWSLAVSVRCAPRATATAQASSRLQRLLALGLLHGVVLYFGDILCVYALCGWWVLRQVHRPWAILRRRLRQAFCWALVLWIAMAALGLLALVAPMPETATGPEPGLADVSTWSEWWQMQARAFALIGPLGLLFLSPFVAWLMLMGVAVARLRGLTHRRWASARRRLFGRLFLPSLFGNALYGAGMVMSSLRPESRLLVLDSVVMVIGPAFTAAAVAGVCQAWAKGRWRGIGRLAPLGRRTLTLYIGHALWCAFVFGGAGLALDPGPAGILALSIGLWWAALILARRSSNPWLLESWVSRVRS